MKGASAWSLRVSAALLAITPLAFVFRSVPSLFFKPLSEDGFYSLAVARNLALGHGLTIDGTHLTNGFQPLVTVVESVAFLDHGDRAIGIRLVMVISWLVLVATCAVVAAICRDLATSASARRIAPWLGVVALLSGRYVLYAFNGLETGGELLAVALVWRLYQVRGARDRWSAVALGAALGGIVLVRIDGIALVAVVAIGLLVAYRDRAAWMYAGLVAAAAAVVSSPWWIFNQVEFGHLLPTSGRAEESVRLTASRLPSLVIGAAQDIVPWGYTAKFQTTGFSIAELIVVGLLAVWLWRRPVVLDGGTSADDRLARGRQFAVWLAAALALLALFYFVETDAVWFYGRYLAPAVVLSAVTATTLVANRRVAVTPVLVGVAVVALAIGVAFTFHFDTNATSPYYNNQLALITEHVPPHAYVAAGQSGTIGFFRADVVNLDGKVNQQALDHQSDMWKYLKARKIAWLCDQPDYVAQYLTSNPGQFGWVEVAHRNGFELWQNTST